MDLNNLKKIWLKESKTNIFYIENVIEESRQELIEQDLLEDNPKFYPYLIIKVKKKLKIKSNNSTLKSFKNFLKDK